MAEPLQGLEPLWSRTAPGEPAEEPLEPCQDCSEAGRSRRVIPTLGHPAVGDPRLLSGPVGME